MVKATFTSVATGSLCHGRTLPHAAHNRAISPVAIAFDFEYIPTALPEERNRMLSEFKNEPFTDFNKPENKAAMEAALQKVQAELGREYPLVIGGERITGLKT